jgi:ribonuclease T2
MTYDDRSPQYCSNEKLDTSSLTDTTLARLNCAWISSTGSNEGFWSHEWEKHGTCAGFTSQEDYFKATLDANDRYDLNVAFANAGISFSGANTSPTVSQLEDAMRDEFGIRGQVVKCEGDDLFEVYMCLDWDTLEAFECDSSFWNTCGGGSSNVVFPEGSGDSAASCELAPSSLSGSSSGKESTGTATSAALVAAGVFGLAFLPLL